MLNTWEQEYPSRKSNIFYNISLVVPSHRADASLLKFSDIKKTGDLNADSFKTRWFFQK